MFDNELGNSAETFFTSLGFPKINTHRSLNHFDFTKANRRILVIGPMGSGKTEYSARVWRDAQIAQTKSLQFARRTKYQEADRREVFFIRSILDVDRFPDYPDDALAYRGGYESLGNKIAHIRDSFELERLIQENPHVGTWIIDEASFYDERIAYVIRREAEKNQLVFIFPTLILNFRKEIFNSSARLLLDISTDVFPLSAYCEHEDCMADSFFTYRYYLMYEKECPALYFDPLIVIGGDRVKDDPKEPNYCTRCEKHHYLPGKEYTYLILKPLGVEASKGNLEPLRGELRLLHEDIESSLLYQHFLEKYSEDDQHNETKRNALLVPCISEKALLYLFIEQNLISEDQCLSLISELKLDEEYIRSRITDNGRHLQSELP